MSFSCMAFGFAYLSGYTAEGNPNRMILQDPHLPYPPYQPSVMCNVPSNGLSGLFGFKKRTVGR